MRNIWHCEDNEFFKTHFYSIFAEVNKFKPFYVADTHGRKAVPQIVTSGDFTE